VKVVLLDCIQVEETKFTVSWNEVMGAMSWIIKIHPEAQPNNQAVSEICSFTTYMYFVKFTFILLLSIEQKRT